jgi:lipoyl-dependent peroxiredoxin
MANIERGASAVWNGNLREGNGSFSSNSGALSDIAYSFATRFEQAPGSNPEELLAAANAACFSMFLAATLTKQGYQPQRIETRATCIMEPQQPSGFKITRMRLETEASVDGIDDAAFQEAVKTSEQGCPVSQALGAITIEAEGRLV